MVQSSKTQKKRKKKSKPKVEKCNSEDSSIIFEFDTNSPAAKDAEPSLEPEQRPELDSPVSSTAEQVYEIQLTDDLADSLVNPPTDPEISEEEESPACDSIVHSIQSNTETEIENNSSSEPIIEAVTTPSNELVDIEVRDITQIIHPETPSLQETDISTSEAKVTKPASKISEKKEDVVTTASVAKPSDSQSKNEGANKTEKKSKNKKPKKGSSKSAVLSSSGDDEKKIAKEPITEAKSDSVLAPQVSSSNDNKKSWSSVIKSSLPQPQTSAEPAAEPVASPKPEKKSTGSKKENSAEQRSKRRIAAEEKKHKSSIERSDSWENIPVSVTQQEDSWEKTAKKGKKKNKRKTEDSRKEKVTFEKEASVEASAAEPVSPVPSAKTEPVSEKVPQPQDLSLEAEMTSAEAEAKEDAEADTEKRKLKKRRKKADSVDPEAEAANAHRVLICDEQVRHCANNIVLVSLR